MSGTARWIIGPRDDLAWIIGSVAASYALLAAYHGAGLPVIPIILVWVLLFDGPHIFGTLTRTWLDRRERAERARLLYGSLALFAIGPACALVPWLLPPEPGGALVEWTRRHAFEAFVFVASMWAFHHIVMQHYGFMMLYKVKNADLEPRDNAVDRAFLVLALFAPFAPYMLVEPEARQMWPWTLSPGFERALRLGLPLLAGVAASVFLARQAQRLWRGRPLDVPKLLLLAAVVPMYWTVLRAPLPPRVMVPILTVSHNIQYQRLVWFHNRNKYRVPRAPELYGAASAVSRSFRRYWALGLLFALYRVPNVMLLDSDVAVGFFWGFSLVHYQLDAHIWAVRKDPQLALPLRLAAA